MVTDTRSNCYSSGFEFGRMSEAVAVTTRRAASPLSPNREQKKRPSRRSGQVTRRLRNAAALASERQLTDFRLWHRQTTFEIRFSISPLRAATRAEIQFVGALVAVSAAPPTTERSLGGVRIALEWQGLGTARRVARGDGLTIRFPVALDPTVICWYPVSVSEARICPGGNCLPGGLRRPCSLPS